MFGIGLGWNFSYVAATAELADKTVPVERGKLLGFTDLLAGLLSAVLASLGGLILAAVGLAGIGVAGLALTRSDEIGQERLPSQPPPTRT